MGESLWFQGHGARFSERLIKVLMDDAGAYFFPHADFYQAGDSERGLSAFIIGAWGMVVMIIAFLDGQPVRQFERRRWCSPRVTGPIARDPNWLY